MTLTMMLFPRLIHHVLFIECFTSMSTPICFRHVSFRFSLNYNLARWIQHTRGLRYVVRDEGKMDEPALDWRNLFIATG